MVTPVDFHTEENLLSKWARKLDVDRLVDALGNVPGELLNAAFIALMPLRLTARKYAGLADIADDRAALENFLRMERWIHDSPDQAGTAFREFIRAFFQENRLVRGGLEIGGRAVDPRAISCPILNIFAAQDHLVPPSASTPLKDLTGEPGLHAVRVRRRAHRHLCQPECAGTPAADHRPMAGKPLTRDSHGHRLAWETR